MGYGLWVMGYALLVMGYGLGLWVMGYGLWVMGYALLVMGYGLGLWVMGYGLGPGLHPWGTTAWTCLPLGKTIVKFPPCPFVSTYSRKGVGWDGMEMGWDRQSGTIIHGKVMDGDMVEQLTTKQTSMHEHSLTLRSPSGSGSSGISWPPAHPIFHGHG
jgi:hypothetical protein